MLGFIVLYVLNSPLKGETQIFKIKKSFHSRNNYNVEPIHSFYVCIFSTIKDEGLTFTPSDKSFTYFEY